MPPFQPSLATAPLAPGDIERLTETLKPALERALKASKLPSMLDDVTIDPRSGGVTITYTIPRMAGPTETKEGLIYTGFQLIWAATTEDEDLRSFTLRGFAYPPADRRAAVAMIADVTAADAAEARNASDYLTVQRYLDHCWWRTDLVAATP